MLLGAALHYEGNKPSSLQMASTLTNFKWIRAGCVKIIKILEETKESCFYHLGVGKFLLRRS